VPPKRGEVWLFDCGMVEKVRPVLIFSVPFAEADRAVRKVGALNAPQLASVEAAVFKWLGRTR
jgi:hypothetical protein